jgi:outer membrane cobalamin receptor
MVHIRDLYGDNFRNNPLKNYSVVNFNFDFKLLHYTTLNFSLKNAFNEQYQSIYGYPMPARMLTAEMSIAY